MRVSRTSLNLAAVVVALISVLVFGGFNEAQSGWQEEWEKTANAAREEGRIVIYGSRSVGDVFAVFQKAHPDIRVTFVSGSGSQNSQRILTERRAGKRLADLYAGGVDSGFLLYRSGAFDPLPPVFILPDVKDQSKWFNGKHHYADPRQSHIFVYEGSAQPVAAYNTKMVDPDLFKSHWDFLRPEWKDKMVSRDTRGRGGISQRLRFFYHHPDLGPEFVSKLFGETGIVLSRDRRQMVDWLARGKYPISFETAQVTDAMEQGLPVALFSTAAFKEGALVDPRVGSVGLIKNAAHPNAAKFAINWLLSRAGQSAFQSATTSNSMREDISKDNVAPMYRRIKGVKYLFTTRPEWIDMRPIYLLLKKAR